jgi:hypothetical protein
MRQKDRETDRESEADKQNDDICVGTIFSIQLVK